METFLTLLRQLQDEDAEPEEARISAWPVARDREREIVLRFDPDDIDVAQRVFDDLEGRQFAPRRSGDLLTIAVAVYN